MMRESGGVGVVVLEDAKGKVDSFEKHIRRLKSKAGNECTNRRGVLPRTMLPRNTRQAAQLDSVDDAEDSEFAVWGTVSKVMLFV